MQCKAANELYTMKRTIILLAAVLMPLLASAQLNITSPLRSRTDLASTRIGGVLLYKNDFGFNISAETRRGRMLILHLGNDAAQAIATLEDLNGMLKNCKVNDYVTVYSRGCYITISKATSGTLLLIDDDRAYEGAAYLYRTEIKKFLNAIKRYESTTN